jgi:hypothetical protein
MCLALGFSLTCLMHPFFMLFVVSIMSIRVQQPDICVFIVKADLEFAQCPFL